MSTFDLVTQNETFFYKVLTDDSVNWEKESQFAIQTLQKNDYTAKAAMNNPASLQNALINVAAIGISLNPAQKHAYLVPRDGAICLDVSYQGMLHLAQVSGSIAWGQSKLVYQNDHFELQGVDKAPSHKQDPFGDKGPIVGAYCVVKTPTGDYLTECMDMDALNKVKATSKAAKGPWKTWPDEMMRKTVVKRASKYWPKCERLNMAVDVVNSHEGLNEVDMGAAPVVVDCIDPDQVQNLIAALEMAGMSTEEFCKAARIDQLENMPISRYSEALEWLKTLVKGAE